MERLRGVGVQWLNRAGDPEAVVGPSEMVVREVRFSRAAETGSSGEVTPTGDIVVTLSFEEGYISMVRREMAAQIWAIAGGVVAGVLLTIFAWIGGGAFRRLCSLKVLNRAHRDEEADSRADTCPTCQEDVSDGAGSTEKAEGA